MICIVWIRDTWVFICVKYAINCKIRESITILFSIIWCQRQALHSITNSTWVHLRFTFFLNFLLNIIFTHCFTAMFFSHSEYFSLWSHFFTIVSYFIFKCGRLDQVKFRESMDLSGFFPDLNLSAIKVSG